jgi:hypothetical protein
MVNFKHQYITQPKVMPANIAIKAIKDLTNALKGKNGEKQDNEFTALEQLEKLVINKLTAKPKKSSILKPLPQDSHQSPRVREATHDTPAFNTRLNTWKTDTTDLDIAMHKIETQPDTISEYANAAVLHPETGRPMKYRQLIAHPDFKVAWNRSSTNEFGQLAQGITGRIKGTNTIEFICKEEVPLDRLRDVTYGKFVCELKPNKEEVERTRLAMGGNKVNYPFKVGTPTAEMLLVKTHLNSVVLTLNARYMMIDISNFYLNTPMVCLEYFKVKLSDILNEVIDEYNLRNIATLDGYVYIEVTKGMYGLLQAGLFANELLEKQLEEHGYKQSKIIPGLWGHDTRDITFTLVVDDFGVKYVAKADALHLADTLKQNYKITEDWSSLSTGTMRTERYTCRCQDMCIKHSKDSNI